jgi:prepilin-type N-terminal cleavage/methylation domain-containing protein
LPPTLQHFAHDRRKNQLGSEAECPTNAPPLLGEFKRFFAEVERFEPGEAPRDRLATPRGNKGFTLIELLVVVSIVVLLMSLLLPTLRRSRNVGKRVVCASQVRSWNLMAINYAQDYKDWLPAHWNASEVVLTYPNVVGPVFRSTLKSYGYTTSKIVFCPDGVIDSAWQSIFEASTGGSLEYTYYGRLRARNVGAATVWSPYKVTDLKDQAGRASILFSDVSRYDDPVTPLHATHPNYGTPAFAYDSPAMPGHTYYTQRADGLNVGYLDASVAWINWEKINTTVYYLSGDYSFHWAKP